MCGLVKTTDEWWKRAVSASVPSWSSAEPISRHCDSLIAGRSAPQLPRLGDLGTTPDRPLAGSLMKPTLIRSSARRWALLQSSPSASLGAADSLSVPAGVGVGVGGRLNDRTRARRRNAFDSGQVAARGRPHTGRAVTLTPHSDRSGNSSASSLSCDDDRSERILPLAGCVASRLTRNLREASPVVLGVIIGLAIVLADIELYRRRIPLTGFTSPAVRCRPRIVEPGTSLLTDPSRGDALRCRGLGVNTNCCPASGDLLPSSAASARDRSSPVDIDDMTSPRRRLTTSTVVVDHLHSPHLPMSTSHSICTSAPTDTLAQHPRMLCDRQTWHYHSSVCSKRATTAS